MWQPFIELNPARDEWSGEALGLFVGEFCVLGIRVWPSGIALIVLNLAVGVWRDDGWGSG